MSVSLEDQIAVVEREIILRKRIYPEWIHNRSITVDTAEREIAGMEAVLSTLKGVREDRKRVGLFDTTAEAIDR